MLSCSTSTRLSIDATQLHLTACNIYQAIDLCCLFMIWQPWFEPSLGCSEEERDEWISLSFFYDILQCFNTHGSVLLLKFYSSLLALVVSSGCWTTTFFSVQIPIRTCYGSACWTLALWDPYCMHLEFMLGSLSYWRAAVSFSIPDAYYLHVIFFDGPQQWTWPCSLSTSPCVQILLCRGEANNLLQWWEDKVLK